MNVSDAFYNTVHDYDGGCEAVAARLGMSAQVLRNKANPNNPSNKPTLDEADRIIGLTGDHRIIDALAQNHGFVLVPKNGDAPVSDMAVLELIAQVWRAEGEVGAEVNQTLADGKVEPREVEKVRAAVYHVEKMLETLVKRLEGMAEK